MVSSFMEMSIRIICSIKTCTPGGGQFKSIALVPKPISMNPTECYLFKHNSMYLS